MVWSVEPRISAENMAVSGANERERRRGERTFVSDGDSTDVVRSVNLQSFENVLLLLSVDGSVCSDVTGRVQRGARGRGKRKKEG